MRKAISAAVLAAVVSLAACDKALTEAPGPLSGTWTYRATGFQPSAVDSTLLCDVASTYVFRVEGDQIEGRSSVTRETCTVRGRPAGTTSHEPLVVRGEVREGRIYITNGGGWHSFGEIRGDTVSGYMESYGNYTGEPMRTVRSGSFQMVKTSGDGYDGPAA